MIPFTAMAFILGFWLHHRMKRSRWQMILVCRWRLWEGPLTRRVTGGHCTRDVGALQSGGCSLSDRARSHTDQPSWLRHNSVARAGALGRRVRASARDPHL